MASPIMENQDLVHIVMSNEDKLTPPGGNTTLALADITYAN